MGRKMAEPQVGRQTGRHPSRTQWSRKLEEETQKRSRDKPGSESNWQGSNKRSSRRHLKRNNDKVRNITNHSTNNTQVIQAKL